LGRGVWGTGRGRAERFVACVMLPARVQRFPEEGNQHVDAAPADVVFIVSLAPHASFVRDGDNLRRSISISLQQALLGFSEGVVHLDGRVVTVTNNAPTRPGGSHAPQRVGVSNCAARSAGGRWPVWVCGPPGLRVLRCVHHRLGHVGVRVGMGARPRPRNSGAGRGHAGAGHVCLWGPHRHSDSAVPVTPDQGPEAT
jgi:hypothetical protein